MAELAASLLPTQALGLKAEDMYMLSKSKQAPCTELWVKRR